MRKIVKIYLVSIAAVLSAISAAASRPVPEHLFQYPEPPEDSVTLMQRTNYLVERFWERCPFKSAIKQRGPFKEAFTDYISFMPYASPEVVKASVQGLLSSLSKEPDVLLALGETAEDVLYDIASEYRADMVFVDFAEAVTGCKKIPSAKKARLAREAKIIKSSMAGSVAPEIEFRRPDGSKGRLGESEGKYVILFFNDPDCDDCRMARVRLSADHNLNELIDAGFLSVVSIYPGDYDAAWAEEAKGFNPRWTVGAQPDVDDDYDLRLSPSIYYLDPEGRIISKWVTVENLISGLSEANRIRKQQ